MNGFHFPLFWGMNFSSNWIRIYTRQIIIFRWFRIGVYFVCVYVVKFKWYFVRNCWPHMAFALLTCSKFPPALVCRWWWFPGLFLCVKPPWRDTRSPPRCSSECLVYTLSSSWRSRGTRPGWRSRCLGSRRRSRQARWWRHLSQHQWKHAKG